MHLFLSRDQDEASGIHIPTSPEDHLSGLGRQLNRAEQRRDHLLDRAVRLAGQITLPAQYRIVAERDTTHPEGRCYYRIACVRPDTYTGIVSEGYGGKAYLDESATDSDLVRTIFGLYVAYVEHEARETFMFNGRRVFGPHMNIWALWEAAEFPDTHPAQRTDPR